MFFIRFIQKCTKNVDKSCIITCNQGHLEWKHLFFSILEHCSPACRFLGIGVGFCGPTTVFVISIGSSSVIDCFCVLDSAPSLLASNESYSAVFNFSLRLTSSNRASKLVFSACRVSFSASRTSILSFWCSIAFCDSSYFFCRHLGWVFNLTLIGRRYHR